MKKHHHFTWASSIIMRFTVLLLAVSCMSFAASAGKLINTEIKVFK